MYFRIELKLSDVFKWNMFKLDLQNWIQYWIQHLNVGLAAEHKRESKWRERKEPNKWEARVLASTFPCSPFIRKVGGKDFIISPSGASILQKSL